MSFININIAIIDIYVILNKTIIGVIELSKALLCTSFLICKHNKIDIGNIMQ